MKDLNEIARSERFETSNKSDRATIILWYLHSAHDPANGVSLSEISDAFHDLQLVRPKPDRLKAHFKKSKNVRRIANGGYAPSRNFANEMTSEFHSLEPIVISDLNIDDLTLPPFVAPERKDDLKRMVQIYARLFLLENSMRGFIEQTLEHSLGEDWWDQCSNSRMKQKHQDRLGNEAKKKWAPARSDFGPLYALDWPDLITIMRKYPQLFEQTLKEISFLHRFEDAGTYRNVVAHNGVLRDDDDFNLIKIYYRDWVRQLS